MKRKNRLGFKILSLLCALVVVVTSVIPLNNTITDARLLGLVFGAMASGVLPGYIVKDIRDRKKQGD